MASRLLWSIFVIMAAATILAVSAGGDGQSSPEKSQAMARHYLRCMRRKTHAFDWWPEKSFHDEIVDQGCRVSFMSIEGSYRTTGLLPDGYMEALQINHQLQSNGCGFPPLRPCLRPLPPRSQGPLHTPHTCPYPEIKIRFFKISCPEIKNRLIVSFFFFFPFCLFSYCYIVFSFFFLLRRYLLLLHSFFFFLFTKKIVNMLHSWMLPLGKLLFHRELVFLFYLGTFFLLGPAIQGGSAATQSTCRAAPHTSGSVTTAPHHCVEPQDTVAATITCST